MRANVMVRECRTVPSTVAAPHPEFRVNRPLLPAAFAAASLLFSASAFGQAASTSLTLGETVDGELTTDDDRSPERQAYEDRWLFVGEAGQSIDIQLTSEAIDTYLYLYDPSGAMVMSDDDSLGNLDSRIRYTLPTSGTYQIATTTFSTDATGPYSLLLREDIRHPLNVVTLDGTTASGTLGDNDAEHQWRGYVEAVDVEVEAGETVIVTVHSDAFDTYGWLLSPTHEVVTEADDSGMSTDAVLVHRATMSGTWRVLVGAYSQGSTGPWTVSVERIETADVPPTPIASNDTVQGSLEARDSGYRDGRFADVYTIDLDAGERLTVEHRSDAFDAWLSIEDPNGRELVSDDDSAGNLNSAASIVASEDGLYRIVATSLGMSMGAYSLTAVVSDVPDVDVDRIRLGEEIDSTLDAEDPPRAAGAGYIETFTFDGEAGQNIVIEASTWSVDLMVTAPTGEQVFGTGEVGMYGYDPYMYEDMYYDDYGMGGMGGLGMGVDSTPRRFEATLHVDGEWTIAVRSSQLAPTPYTMTVSASEDVQPETTEIALGAEVSGNLDANDTRSPDRGTWMDIYTLTVTEPSMYEIALDSEDFDGYLELMGGATWLSNDDTDGYNPRITARLEPGTYEITATSFATAEGAYTLRTRAMESVPPTINAIAIGDTVDASMDAGTPTSALRGSAAHWYRLELEAGQSVTATMTSDAFDTYLILVNELGESVISDDDSAGNLDARIVYTAPTAGTYTIVATTYSSGSTGAYTLEVAP